MVLIPRWQTILIVLVVLFGLFYAAPNLLQRDGERTAVTGLLPDKQVSLGLDLQGGVRIVIDVVTDDVANDYLTSLESSVRSPLRRARITINAPEVADGQMLVRPKNPADLEEVYQALRDVANDVTVTKVGGAVALTIGDSELADRVNGIVDQSVEVVRRRVDPSGLLEPSIKRSQATRIQVEIPGIGAEEMTAIKDRLNRAAKLEFRFVEGNFPAETAALGTMLVPDEQSPEFNWAVSNTVMITGDMIIDSQPTFDQDGGPATSLRFDGVGSNRFAKATAEENVGRRFAIILDGKVISAPSIIQQITGGSGQITGMGTTAAANELSILLRAGALPAPLVILEERLVGPGLGADSIKAGAYASVLGLILVLIFMAVMYGRFGIFANVALVANLILLVALLSAFGAVLTLPGIAGIVLTIGMAVDANVLVFERIREEYATSGRIVRSIETGYNSALSTILDANITTIIAAAVLAIFSDGGPVRGFAITLSIGIITSMFSALMVTRLLVAWWASRNENSELPMGKRNEGVRQVIEPASEGAAS